MIDDLIAKMLEEPEDEPEEVCPKHFLVMPCCKYEDE
jgi:hypothetical protein